MILVDFSSTMHRCLYNQVKHTNPTKVNDKLVTEEFQNYWKYLVLEELFKLNLDFQPYVGELGIVLCLDYHNKLYWRKEFYPEYKQQRQQGREESEIDFEEFFQHQIELITVLKTNTPWKVFETEGQEADDLILILAKEFQDSKEPILIHSPDKDFIQAQRYSPKIKQFSPMTRKYITPDTKGGDMQTWIQEHICLGDDSDNVPKITDDTEFSEEFLEYLNGLGVAIDEYDYHNFNEETKAELLQNFDVYDEGSKTKEPQKKVFKKIRFGQQSLKKKIDEYGSMDDFIRSSKMLTKHFKRNYELVMEEGIPDYIRKDITKGFERQTEEAKNFDQKLFENYLKENNLNSILSILPKDFRTEITLDFFEDW